MYADMYFICLFHVIIDEILIDQFADYLAPIAFPFFLPFHSSGFLVEGFNVDRLQSDGYAFEEFHII